jgi:hypothetical protein
MRIWKWGLKREWIGPLMLDDKKSIEMPAGARLLAVGTQFGFPCIWAMCDETAPLVWRMFAIYGTGHQLPRNPGTYVGTVMTHNDDPVWHIFDLGEQLQEAM